jgi:hypothetical protein
LTPQGKPIHSTLNSPANGNLTPSSARSPVLNAPQIESWRDFLRQNLVKVDNGRKTAALAIWRGGAWQCPITPAPFKRAVAGAAWPGAALP